MSAETIRWFFVFDEGNVKADLTNVEDDARIGAFIAANPKGILALPPEKDQIWVNLDMVKCIVRTLVDVEAEKAAHQNFAISAPTLEGAHEQ